MRNIVGIFTLAIMGVIVADIITHPAGTTAASNGIANLSRPWSNALLGVPS